MLCKYILKKDVDLEKVSKIFLPKAVPSTTPYKLSDLLQTHPWSIGISYREMGL